MECRWLWRWLHSKIQQADPQERERTPAVLVPLDPKETLDPEAVDRLRKSRDYRHLALQVRYQRERAVTKALTSLDRDDLLIAKAWDAQARFWALPDIAQAREDDDA